MPRQFFVVILLVFLFFKLAESTLERTTLHPPSLRTCIFKTCDCSLIGDVISVFCQDTINFNDLKAWRNDGFFKELLNHTYEIHIKNIHIVPPFFLQNLTVSFLRFEDPLMVNITDEAFDGVKKLTTFEVKTSSIKVLPNFKKLNETLQYLHFDNSSLTIIRTQVQYMTALIELTFRNNSIQIIEEDAFQGLRHLEVLDLSRNLLSNLSPKLLIDLKSLKSLYLSHNYLVSVVGLFATTSVPANISLNHNNFTDVNNILVHETMKNVETLNLDHNPLKNIKLKGKESTFLNYIPNIQSLHLSHCFLDEFKFSLLSNCSSIHYIDLSSNLIQNITKEDIDFGSNLIIDLSENEISTFEAELSHKVQALNISGNRLQYLNSMLHFSQPLEVDVSRNELVAILEPDFKSMHGIEKLNFSQNNIIIIDKGSFFTLRNDLQVLDLSKNKIQNLNESVAYLSTLIVLNISYNNIQIFYKYEFIGMSELKELHAQSNRIVVLHSYLQILPKLQYLGIEDNAINMITKEQLPNSLKLLNYKGNPINCNCQSLLFLNWIRKSANTPKVDVNYCRNYEKNADNTYPRVFDCPHPCKCFCRQDNKALTINCSGLNLTNPPGIFQNGDNLTTLDSIIVRQNMDSQFFISDEVIEVNLKNNNFSSLENWKFPRNLKALWLERNRLTSLPDNVTSLPALKSISLSYNPWSCDCDAVIFKRWVISKMEDIMDANNTHCGSSTQNTDLRGKLLVDLSDVDMCPISIELYVTIIFCVLVLLLATAALKIAYNHHELHIKVWLYAHGFTWIKEKEIDQDKPFDAFISFSNEDDQFVISEIINEIESRLPDIRLCLHYRHFLPGEFIQDNIMNAVKCSKRTVLILTKNFLISEWCLMEFKAAHNQALEDKINRIIIVKVGEMPDELDPLIKTYLETITYVTWGEKYFWEKFIYALPIPEMKQRSFSVTSNTTLI